MKKLTLVPILAGLLCSTALAVDTVKRISGPSVSGTLQKISSTEVAIEKQVGGAETIPVSDVDVVYFDGEPSLLRIVRSNAANGSFDSALTSLARINEADVTKPDVKAEMQFYKALCEAKLALGGGAKVNEAGKAMFAFVQQNPNSHHFLDANEVLGDLLVAAGDFEQAKKYFGVLEQSSFPEYKIRANVATGRALRSQGKFAEAQAAFDNVLAQTRDARGPMIESQKFAAMLGKAACLAELNQADEGIKLVQESIKGLNPEASDVLAQAYVTLGKCYEKKDAKKEAVRAYLHVDLLFATHPQSHAEALKRLAALWTELGKPERSREALDALQGRYGG